MDHSVVTSERWVIRTQQLLDSYEHWLHEPLITRTTPTQDAITVANADFVLVAHGGESDPLLNFANAKALALWEMPLETFLGTPSRRTAEPVHRAERAELLKQTTQNGYISDYAGIRIASSGRRFMIHQAVVWNVLDSEGHPAGQAATFSRWTMLDDNDCSQPSE